MFAHLFYNLCDPYFLEGNPIESKSALDSEENLMDGIMTRSTYDRSRDLIEDGRHFGYNLQNERFCWSSEQFVMLLQKAITSRVKIYCVSFLLH